MKKHLLTICIALFVALGASAQSNVRLSTSVKEIDFSKITEKTTQVTLTRFLMAGYNSICLPFSVSADDLRTAVGEGVQLERLAKVEDNSLYFIDVTSEGIKAGVPYLIYSPTRKTASFRTHDLNMVDPTPLIVNGATMFSSYVKQTPTGVYGIPAQQDTELLQSILIKVDGDKSFMPTRCGISIGVENPEICHVTSLNETTSISTLIAEDAVVNVYSVSGSQVASNIKMSKALETLPKGIYVTNGQKFLVK